MKTVRVLAAALLALAPLAAALWPRPEAFTVGRHTFCLARDVEWKAEQGFRSDILEAGFERCVGGCCTLQRGRALLG